MKHKDPDMSDLTTPFPELAPASRPAIRRLAIPGRVVKLSLAAVIVSVGLYGILSERQYVSTSDAVISTYVLEIRTPIEGTLQNMTAAEGDVLQRGQLLARISNPLIDRQHLDDLRITEQVAQSTAESLKQEQRSLERMRATLVSRAALHSANMSSRLEQDSSQAVSLLREKEAALAEAELELRRGQQLFDVGVISRAAVDKLRADKEALAGEVSAQRAAYASIEAQRKAAKQGILSEPGTNNDVAYSLQRADEVSIKLLDGKRALNSAVAQARQAHSEAEAEARRTSVLGGSELRAPNAGLIWKLNAVDGEHVRADAPVLSIVDCSKQFVMAEIPQDRVSKVDLSSPVQIRATGEAEERTGTVVSISGDSKLELDSKLAATPVRKPGGDLASVVIRLDPPAGHAGGTVPCLVGRTARVRIPTQPTNPLSVWLSDRM